jgi:uncharacterized membrane protein YraQ (UPF0718 family)
MTTTTPDITVNGSAGWGELKKLAGIAAIFVLVFFLPVGNPRFDNAVGEAMHLTKWYAREHVLLCLVPAFFIAGAIGVFVRQSSVMRYLGAGAPKPMAYGVASVSGTILAVCSCTVLPLFAGIWRMGAGLGPATAFLYSGPAINVLAIILTARILGVEIGLVRALGAVVFSVLIGLLMHLIYRKEDQAKITGAGDVPDDPPERRLWQTVVYFACMIAILVFANWGKPDQPDGFFAAVHLVKWMVTLIAAAGLAVVLVLWFGIPWWKMLLGSTATALAALLMPELPLVSFTVASVAVAVILATTPGDARQWFDATWSFAKQILPLLLIGVLISGFLLGRPDHEGLIPSQWVAKSVGGNSLGANLFASIAGAFMYFATLTEVPILQGLIGSGMGKGPALALLLAGPALSLPSMLVLRSVMGTQKTIVYVSLVIVMATLSGLIYGALP